MNNFEQIQVSVWYDNAIIRHDGIASYSSEIVTLKKQIKIIQCINSF